MLLTYKNELQYYIVVNVVIHTTVAEHFLSHPNHCHTDMQLIPLELIHSSRDSIRKARESFLIDLARTLEPHGMNRRDES